MLERDYQNLDKYLEPNKVLVIYGPRRVGKTTLIKQYLKKTRLSYRLENGENLMVQRVLSSQDFALIKDFVGNHELLVFDEAQYIPNVGLGLKIIVDQCPQIRVIATGSSSFDLSGQVGEPLTGRKKTLLLYPLAQLEFARQVNKFDLRQQLPDFLVFGSYPSVSTAKSKKQKQEILEELSQSYLLKDLLALERLKSPQILMDLLKLLAFQIGSEISLNELATQLVIDVKTTGRYLDLLGKTFVIFKLQGFSRNLRKEITSKRKYYFIDLGIRNAIINNFNGLELRDDVGRLWENFLVIERLKTQEYKNHHGNFYFWRTWDKQEVDWVEERGGVLHGYEFKWKDDKQIKSPRDWQKTYEKTTFQIVNRENYFKFLL